MANVVIVVDTLRGFLEADYPLYCGPVARSVIAPIHRLLERERAAGSAIIYVADRHAPDDKEFQVFPPHCIAGTPESEVVPDLAPHPGDVVIGKTRYSGFFGTHLAQKLRELCPDKVIVVGVCTDICVMHTVADARSRDYAVEVPVDCVASFDPEAHKWALQHMERVLGATVNWDRQ
ncbi:MAG: isochorismatase family cysteine hydrolase [Chloroflexota bacterium]|nr:isochorismatase family cysteine hydrolase [Chloroflexota bacterium]